MKCVGCRSIIRYKDYTPRFVATLLLAIGCAVGIGFGIPLVANRSYSRPIGIIVAFVVGMLLAYHLYRTGKLEEVGLARDQAKTDNP